MSRKTVDFPQPEGPRMAMNSPLPGRSGTENVTSRITVKRPNRFVTFWKSTTFGRSGRSAVTAGATLTSILDDAMREQTPLEPEQQAIDTVRQQPDDHQNQDDVLRQSAPLTRHQQIAEAVLGVDQLGEHDVAERQAEEMPQTVVNVRQRQRDEDLPDDLE